MDSNVYGVNEMERHGIPERLMTIQEASAFLGVTYRHLWGLIRSGEVPHVRLGRLIRLRPEALRGWVESKERVGGK